MENINLIRQLTWTFYKKNKGIIEWDDLFGEAVLAYTKATKAYNKTQTTKLTTYAYIVIKNALLACIKKEQTHQNTISAFRENIQTQKAPSLFYPTGLSSNTRTVIEMLVSDVSNMTRTPTRAEIKQELRTLGWSWPQIWKCFKELRSQGKKKMIKYDGSPIACTCGHKDLIIFHLDIPTLKCKKCFNYITTNKAVQTYTSWYEIERAKCR